MAVAPGYPIEQLRQRLKLLESVTYLNSGTVGIMPEPVLERHLNYMAEYERGGHWSQGQAKERFERARSTLATLINATPEEVAFTGNATDGVNLVAAGLKLTPDDVVLTTNEEHPAVLVPWTAAQLRGGARLEIFSVGATPDETLANFEAALKPATRIVVASHVSCETGRRIPAAEICRICRDRGIITLIDGAQSVGQFPVDVRTLGCDFMTGNGHKWLMGPKGTGFLYGRIDAISLVEPIHVGDGSINPSFDRITFSNLSKNPWSFEPSARRFEFGTRNWHTFAAIHDSVRYLEEIGLSQIEQHCAAISEDLKQRLRDEQGVTVHSPSSWDESCGLVTFSLDGWEGVDLSKRLWDEYTIAQRRVQVPNGIRISCAYFTSEPDIERLIGAVRDLRDQT